MLSMIVLGGVDGASLADYLQREFGNAQARAVGIASAFVSVRGVTIVDALLPSSVKDRRLAAGVDNFLTQPEALKLAKSKGWNVRLGRSEEGLFHPKLMVAGQAFDVNGVMLRPSLLYVGSGNLTSGGLSRNVECGLLSRESKVTAEGGQAFDRIWRSAVVASDEVVRAYAQGFVERNRTRTDDDLVSMEIYDEVINALSTLSSPVLGTPPHLEGQTVWAELTSFTGQYALQVEFPRAAAEILRRFVTGKLTEGNKVPIKCEDGVVREMMARYYEDNSMYRLNVPLVTPGVARARAERNGIAVVRRSRTSGGLLRLHLVPPGDDMNRIVARSFAQGTWGRTRTRLFGWS
jgi:HKD family nuclease